MDIAINQLNESDILEKGNIHLSGDSLKQMIVGKKMRGDYLYGYKYEGKINSDGTMEGVNNVGSHHVGKWSIDLANHTLTFVWNTGWENWTAKAYKINDEIHLFDIETGNWRTSFNEIYS